MQLFETLFLGLLAFFHVVFLCSPYFVPVSNWRDAGIDCARPPPVVELGQGSDPEA